MNKRKNRILLEENEIPTQWYNIIADMPNKPKPPLHPVTKQPVGPEDLSALFPMELIKQEASTDRWIDIPEEILEFYKTYRPTPLYRAYQLEKALDTPAKIYYKYEGSSPSGSHKLNTAIAQAYYNKMEGVKKITTETGAGQWGSALSYACQKFGIALQVFMVKVSYEQKPYRKLLMNSWDAEVIPSPSLITESGKKILAADPNNPGSLGIAISEAVEMAAKDPSTKYSLGSVLNHVLLHQTIIGLEAIKQFEKTDDFPEVVIASFGGGSNFAGLSFPFLRLNISEGRNVRCVAVEPASCPKLTRGVFRYDFGDTAGLTPLIPMYTLGHNFVPAKIHAGGLRYHGAGAIPSQLLKDNLIEAVSKKQIECFEAGVAFAKAEGILAAPESTFAIAGAIKEANKATEEGVARTILFNLSGHGHFDLSSYEKYFNAQLEDHNLSESEIQNSLSQLDDLTV